MNEWIGDPPETCDLCGTMIENAFVDGALKQGPWAIMCPFCALAYGVGLGIGKGQLYTKCTNTGRFYGKNNKKNVGVEDEFGNTFPANEAGV